MGKDLGGAEKDISDEPEVSPSADTAFLLKKEEEANSIVRFLIGFKNKGTENSPVNSLGASFHYP